MEAEGEVGHIALDLLGMYGAGKLRTDRLYA